MLWLIEDATLVCEHGGKVKIKTSQDLVRIDGRIVLVADDPEGRDINACPFVAPVIGVRPCLHTLVVKVGYSEFVRIEKHSVCLDNIAGLTDGSPPGTVPYKVTDPAQSLVSAGA